MLKSLITQYKDVFKFLGLFIGTYLVLSLAYNGYLWASKDGAFVPDIVTHLVANQSEQIINQVGFTAKVVPDSQKPMLQLFVNGKYVARVIEGCNAISIILLFISFVVAFNAGLKKTLLFIFGGAVLIYAVNLIRIAILAIALYTYPEQEAVLHDVIFPAIIYGMVFLLWMIWVRKLPKNKTDA